MTPTRTPKPNENLMDKRDRLIDEGKLTTCGYALPYAPAYSIYRQVPLRGKVCYYHQKKLEGLV